MALIGLQKGIIYGPVTSRRLGRSLGINLLPASHKLCSFDCIYCHYGRTAVRTLHPAEEGLPSVDDVLGAIENALQAHSDLDFVTFSGNGEPTLHPRFPEIVTGVCQLRDRLRPAAQLAILSNSTGLQLPGVKESLGAFDLPMMKLDAGDPQTLARINRPVPGVKLDLILEGLRGLDNLVIQSVLVDGTASNSQGDAFEAWIAALAHVRPVQVQIYSTDRPVPEAGVERVPPDVLQRLAIEAERRLGSPVVAFWAGT